MGSHRFLPLMLFSLFLFIIANNARTSSAVSSNSQANKAYVTKACNTTPYASQCYKSLAPSAAKINSDPNRLLKYAVSVALADARGVKSRALQVSKTKGLTAAEKAVMRDCLDNVRDTVDELGQCLDALKRVNGSVSSAANSDQVENLKTWASAALTDDYTCTDEMDEEKVGPTRVSKLRESVAKANRSIKILLALISYSSSSS